MRRLFTQRARLPRWVVGVAILIGLGVALRLLLAPTLTYYVNKQLNATPGITGHIDTIDLHILRGRYVVKNIRLDTAGKTPQALFAAKALAVDLSWRQLARGRVIGDVSLWQPAVTLVAPTQKADTKAKPKAPNWQAQVRRLLPIKVTELAIHDGRVRFRDPTQKPKIDLTVDAIQITATNLTNRDSLKDAMFAKVVGHAKPLGDGDLRLAMQIDPLAQAPTFSLKTTLTQVDLTKLNDFLLAYGKFDVNRGTFELYSEFAARDGNFKGYIKPMFRNLEVLNWEEEKDRDNKLLLFWKGIVGTVADVFKNAPHDQLATKIPIEGTFDDPDINVWDAVGSLLRNGFVRALVPSIDHSVALKDVPAAPGGGAKEDAKDGAQSRRRSNN